ncbi:maleylacetoacetate isomerase-like [Babylonia areolata]|uniref:maleylacetoacetate isomerase-like n=1 Tax=Babylonia areolata TaxID=304850 RepID=UPI003FD25E42
MAKPILYSYFRSSASWRVRIALAMKGVEYDYMPVHLVKEGGEQNKEEYKALNPMSQVPTLIIDGVTLTQSLPIIEYLDETRPGPQILPKDAIKRAQARALAEVINSGIQPLQNLKTLAEFGDKKMEWGKTVISRGFDAFEKMLTSTAGKYCVGDEVTIADLCLIPQCYNAQRFSVDMSSYPTIVRIKEALEKLPAFIAADFKNQPDTPDEMKA